MNRPVKFAAVVGCCVFGFQPVLANCPTMDFTGDCRVDIADFALFAEQWLEEGMPEIWVPAPNLNVGRHSVAVTVGADGLIYAIGGWAGPGNLHDTVEAFSEASQSWQWQPEMKLPYVISDAGAVTDSSGCIWLVGGGNNQQQFASVLKYDPKNPDAGWQPQAPLQTPRGGMGIAIAQDDTIYVFGGGNSSGYLKTAEKYDPAVGEWVFIQPMQEERYIPGHAIDDRGRIYAIGGMNAVVPTDGELQTMERYDPETDTWQYLPSIPDRPHAGPAAFFLKGRIWIVGGWDNDMLSSCWIFDTSTDTWMSEPGPALYEGRVCAGAARSQSCTVYLVGGQASAGAATAHVAMMATECPCPHVFYVDDTATGANDGSGWTDAYTSLQSALAAAGSGDEIWVAEGTYKPTHKVGGSGDRYRTFQLKNGVALYGGFSGIETNRDQRDWRVHQTILSGDRAGNDNDTINLNEPTRQDNGYHVVLGADGSYLDGFIITGGNANGSTWQVNEGGGMQNQTVIGAVYKIANCTFTKNTAVAGAGMFNWASDDTKIINCIFSGNTTQLDGGGIFNASCNAEISNCLFVGNQSRSGGGMANSTSAPNLTNCTFSGNSADQRGGGIVNDNTFQGKSPTLTNCIVWGNRVPVDPQISNTSGANAVVSYSDVEGGWAGYANINADPLFNRDPSPGSDNIWGTADDDFGDLRLQSGSPCINTGNGALAADIAEDLDGNPRICGGSDLSIGLLTHWDLNEGSSTVIHDDSGNGYQGDIYGAAWDSGKFGGGLSFVGTEHDYAEIPNTSGLHLQSGLTLSAWVRFTAFNYDTLIVGKHDAGTSNGYFLGIRDNTFAFYVGGDPRIMTSQTWNDGRWHHVAGTYDGIHMKLYIDSNLKVEGDFAYLTTNTVNIRMGTVKNAPSSSPYWLTATIDEIHIYDRPLSPGEICELARAGAVDMGAYERCNQPPVSNAGPDRSIRRRQQHTTIIHGLAADADGDLLQYSWWEGQVELLPWTDVGSQGQADLNLGAFMNELKPGVHPLTLKVREKTDPPGPAVSDRMILTIEKGTSA